MKYDNHQWLQTVIYRKNPKNSDIQKFAIITLKFEQDGFTAE